MWDSLGLQQVGISCGGDISRLGKNLDVLPEAAQGAVGAATPAFRRLPKGSNGFFTGQTKFLPLGRNFFVLRLINKKCNITYAKYGEELRCLGF